MRAVRFCVTRAIVLVRIPRMPDKNDVAREERIFFCSTFVKFAKTDEIADVGFVRGLRANMRALAGAT